ncbi:MAG: CDP-archaeol synthase [bacterium]
MSSTFKRIITSVIFVPILIYCIISKNTLFLLLLICLVIFLGLMEFYSLSSKVQIKPFKIIGVIISLLFALVAHFIPSQFYLLTSILISPLLIGYLLTFFIKRYFLEIGVTLAGVFYISYLLSHILLLKHLQNGSFYIVLLFLITWLTDTFAFGIGLKFGKHKLIPQISPKKSVEGTVAGLIGGILTSIIASLITGYISIIQAIIIGLLLSFCGQVGDLLESKIKRLTGVKDSATWIPGHGGVLDVFDSVIFNAPIIYYYFLFSL